MLLDVSTAFLEVRDTIADAVEAAISEEGNLDVYKGYTIASSLEQDSDFPRLWINVNDLTRSADDRTNRTEIYDINLNIVSAFDQESLIGGERVALEGLMKAYGVIYKALEESLAYVRDISVTDIVPNSIDEEDYVFATMNCAVKIVVK